MKISFLSTLLATLVVCFVGCAGLNDGSVRGPNTFKSMLADEEPEFVDPSSMVAIWKPSTYEKPGTKSIRGFGGRFYFHNAKNEPVKVDGLLTVYGYDDAEGESSGKANRKFVFESNTFQRHHSDSGLGDSYSFWVPWDEVGGLEKTITLIPVFKSANGKIPESQPATLRLPGRRKSTVATAEDSLYGPGTQVISASGIVSDKPMVRHAVAISDDGQPVAKLPPGRRKPTTLKLPRSLAGRIAQANVAQGPNANATRPSNETVEDNIQPVIDKAVAVPRRDETKPQRRRPVFGQPGSF